jgi:hypothetical protein
MASERDSFGVVSCGLGFGRGFARSSRRDWRVLWDSAVLRGVSLGMRRLDSLGDGGIRSVLGGLWVVVESAEGVAVVLDGSTGGSLA